MKTLIVSVDYPLPENKGNRMRTMHFVRYFQKRGVVDLMSYKSHAPMDVVETPFRKEFFIEMNVNKSAENGNPFKGLYNKFVECKPWIVNSFTADTVKNIHEIICREDYDVILCRYSVNAFPLLSLPEKYKKRVLLDIDDIMSSDLYDVVYGVKKGLVKTKAAIDKIIFKRYQMKCLELGKILFCSEADRTKMSKCSKINNKYVVPNIIPQQSLPENYEKLGLDNEYLLFVGVLSYRPNELGIVWFIKEIFNKLPEEYGALKLLVVGRDPQEELKALCANNSRILLVENPPDVTPYFQKCKTVVVPVLVGGGTRIKILEAGNCYRPVITTNLGAYGLDLNDRENVLYFNDRKSFISSLNWLNDDDNYAKMVNNLKATVDRKYTEQTFKRSMDDLLVA